MRPFTFHDAERSPIGPDIDRILTIAFATITMRVSVVPTDWLGMPHQPGWARLDFTGSREAASSDWWQHGSTPSSIILEVPSSAGILFTKSLPTFLWRTILSHHELF